MTEQEFTNESKKPKAEEIQKEALSTIRIRQEKDGPWVEVELLNRGSLWAHVSDGKRKFRVLWQDVHPDDKFDYQ